MKFFIALIVCFVFSSQTLFATPDWPAMLRVHGVKNGDSLNIREKPSARSKVIGKIPPDTRGIKNLGDQWPPSFSDFEPTNESLEDSGFTRTEKEAILSGNCWVKIEFMGVQGWIKEKFVVADIAE